MEDDAPEYPVMPEVLVDDQALTEVGVTRIKIKKGEAEDQELFIVGTAHVSDEVSWTCVCLVSGFSGFFFFFFSLLFLELCRCGQDGECGPTRLSDGRALSATRRTAVSSQTRRGEGNGGNDYSNQADDAKSPGSEWSVSTPVGVFVQESRGRD